MGYRARAIASFLCTVVGAAMMHGCSNDKLSEQRAIIEIEPRPAAGQVVLSSPPGIDLGTVPLFGSATAKFEVRNESAAKLEIESMDLESATGGSFLPVLFDHQGTRVTTWPVVLGARDGEADSGDDRATLEIALTPEAHERLGTGTLALKTNAGNVSGGIATVRVLGEGIFIGQPNLEVQYNGVAYELPGDCTFEGEVCLLPSFDFGNVPLGATATSVLQLRNLPKEGCVLPDRPDGTPNCDAACAVTFDRDPAGRDLGLGFDPAGTGFDFVGATPVPFHITPAKPECPNSSGLVRGELPLLVHFAAGTVEGDESSTLVLESNDPAEDVSSYVGRIDIPVSASTREAPVAVAELRVCSDPENPPPACVDPDLGLEPLGRVYLDGRQSYDPRGANIISYRWELLSAPPGSGTSFEEFDPQGANTPLLDIFLPLAGTYRARLHVTNDAMIESGISPTSDVEFLAQPQSRLHFQLVWDHPENDQDLHLVYADVSPLVFHARSDCFWKSCRPSWEEPAYCLRDGEGNIDDPRDLCRPAYYFYDCGADEVATWKKPSGEVACDTVEDCSAGEVCRITDEDCDAENCGTCGQWQCPDGSPAIQAFDHANPRLDIDDTNGLGPENINITRPKAGTYQIYVHYYGLTDPESAPTLATVRVYVDGILRNEFRRRLDRNDLWAVAQVTWGADGSAAVVQAHSEDPLVPTVQQLFYLPYPNGYDFGSVF